MTKNLNCRIKYNQEGNSPSLPNRETPQSDDTIVTSFLCVLQTHTIISVCVYMCRSCLFAQMEYIMHIVLCLAFSIKNITWFLISAYTYASCSFFPYFIDIPQIT